MKQTSRILAGFALAAATSLAQADSDTSRYFLSGTVGDAPVIGELTVHKGVNAVDGYYVNERSNAELRLSGSFESEADKSSSKLHLFEVKYEPDQPDGLVQGTFEGTWVNGQYTGTWTPPKGKSASFKLSGLAYISDVHTTPSTRINLFYPDFQDPAIRAVLTKVLARHDKAALQPALGVFDINNTVSVSYLSDRYLSLKSNHSKQDPSMAAAHTQEQEFLFEKAGGHWKLKPDGPVASSTECITHVGALLRKSLLEQKTSEVVGDKVTDEKLFRAANWSLRYNGAQAEYRVNSEWTNASVFQVSLNRNQLGACLVTAAE